MSSTPVRRRWLVAVGVTGVVAIPSVLPNTGVDPSAAVVVHAIAGAVLAVGYSVAIDPGTESWRATVLAVGGAMLVVAILEVVQLAVPGRAPMLVDVVAGWSGAVASGAVWMFAPRV